MIVAIVFVIVMLWRMWQDRRKNNGANLPNRGKRKARDVASGPA
jgi:hypothetical protein